MFDTWESTPNSEFRGNKYLQKPNQTMGTFKSKRNQAKWFVEKTQVQKSRDTVSWTDEANFSILGMKENVST